MNVLTEGCSRYQIEPYGTMRVPGVVFAPRPLDAREPLAQVVAGPAALPGILVASYAIPGTHSADEIGTVAATDLAAGGAVSPDGVGIDIACGVRLLAADLDHDALSTAMRRRLLDELHRTVPHGLSRSILGHLTSHEQLDEILTRGARYAVERGHGTLRDLARCEDRGIVPGADPAAVSARAKERGFRQLGSLGPGEHLLQVQSVEEVYDDAAAEVFGLRQGQICVMLHTGSRGLGRQVHLDHVRAMRGAMRRGRPTPSSDQRPVHVPADSAPGRGYLGAATAAANYALVNRQLLTEAIRRAFGTICGTELDLVYDVSHNLARIETHLIGGAPRRLCVHRRLATRALPPGHPGLPPDLAESGQPVLVPGTSGSAAYVLTGVPGNPAFHSAGHGPAEAAESTGLCRRVARLGTVGTVGTVQG